MRDDDRDGDAQVTIELGAFAHQALSDEARRQGVTLEALVTQAAMYYLADVDSGRIAHRQAPLKSA
jgi:hypothetical protein